MTTHYRGPACADRPDLFESTTRAAQTSRPAADRWAADHRPHCRVMRLQADRRPR